MAAIIREGGDSIEVVAIDRVPDHLPRAGDTRLAVTVQSRGFAGEGSAWVDASVLLAFVGQLRQVEARRQGRAELASLSRGEFALRVFATDRAGHMAVAGRLTRAGQALEFEFPFCPSRLPGVVAGFAAMAEAGAELS